MCMKWLPIICHVNSVEQCRTVLTVSTMSTVSTVSTVIARCYLHLRWYFWFHSFRIHLQVANLFITYSHKTSRNMKTVLYKMVLCCCGSSQPFNWLPLSKWRLPFKLATRGRRQDVQTKTDLETPIAGQTLFQSASYNRNTNALNCVKTKPMLNTFWWCETG